MAAPLAVIVRWCGASYPLVLPSTATIADLKRKFSDGERLPCKRQRYKDNTPERNCLNDDVPLSSLTSNIVNLIGLNKKDDNSYKQIFWAVQTGGICHSTDLREPLIDFDGTRVGMSRGTYEVVTMKINCLLKTADAKHFPLDLASFILMRNFKHTNCVALENLYDSGQVLRLILSDSVDGTLAGYVKKNKTGTVFNSDAGILTPFFSKILTELCDVLDKLIAKGICPKSLGIQNLYLKMVGGDPQLKVLFNTVEPLAKINVDRAEQLNKLCGEIKGIFSEYVPNEAMGVMTHLRNFFGTQAVTHIGKTLGKMVKCYPQEWTDIQKSSYLIDLVSCKIDIRPLINRCGIRWPANNHGDDLLEELKTLKRLLEDANKRISAWKVWLETRDPVAAKKLKFYIWNYKTEFPYDIVRLARNLWKHYDTYPPEVQALLGGSRAGVLRALENWCPGVWCLMYNAVGFP